MTDERMGDDLWAALGALPRGSGIIFRHYSLPKAARRDLFEKVARYARRNRHVLIIAGQPVGRAAGCHGHAIHRTPGIKTVPVHSVRERIAAERMGASLIFVSPVFATRSHPDTKPLGRVRFGLLIRGAKYPVIALGGMTARKARSLKLFGIHGWAAIDAFAGQKRTEVPT